MGDDVRPRRHRIKPLTTLRARRLRREAPFPERLLWSRLRAGQIGGVRFRRQHPAGVYVLDFYCPAARVAIELDGVSHEGRERYDAERTAHVESLGIRVIRFTDDEVLRDLDGVVYRIACEIGIEL
jgi:very-short-patch-repair endonuclease